VDALSNHTADKIDHEDNWTAKARMLDLRNIYEVVNHRLDDKTLVGLMELDQDCHVSRGLTCR
jgi:hypothetical protein